eukprot:scaffold1069_cov186-Ochromonas_danica.AAC.9
MLNDWHALGVVQYRKWHVYDMAWMEKGVGVALENYLVCGAPFGGPIALFPDTKRLEQPLKLQIYTSAGTKLAEMDWTDRPIVSMGWTHSETLITVTDQGHIRIYTIFADLVTEFSLLNNGEGVTIIECHFWGNGVAAMTSGYSIKVAEGLSSTDIRTSAPHIYTLVTKFSKEDPYTAMTIIPPLLSKSGLLEVLDAPASCIALSPDGCHLAVYRKDGILTVMSSNFSTKIVDFDTRSASRPVAVEWCGKDAVAIRWLNTGVVLVGPFGDWLNFPYDTPGVVLIPEPDCCRIVTSTTCEILQMVSAPTVAALEIGSTEPAALILDAMEAFEEGDAKSDENIRIMAAANQLQEAVTTCIAAAGAEFHPTQQRRLLQAASYGKAFCPDIDPSDFVETAKRLRVLNEVRRPEIGLPLTMQQYLTLSPEILVGRLTVRREHFLALKICELLRLKNEQVLIDWACEKVRRMATLSQASDEEILRTLRKQIDPFGKITFLRVAEAAHSIGRSRLAIAMLDQEPRPADQIPLLLDMREEELALAKAVQCEDTNLIYFALISLENRLGTGERANQERFFRIVQGHPEALSLLKAYYQLKATVYDRSLLQSLLLHSKSFLEAGFAALRQGLQQGEDQMTKLRLLREAVGLFTQAKDGSFHRTATEEHIDLLQTQMSLELRTDPRQQLVGLSLVETIERLLSMGLSNPSDQRWTDPEIAKLAKRFKVSDKVLCYMRMHLLSDRDDWAGLLRFAMDKKPPIGYKPFALLSIQRKRPEAEVERFIEKIPDLEDRYDLYMDLKAYQRAAEMAARLKDPDRLTEVGRCCRDVNLERYIQELLTRL